MPTLFQFYTQILVPSALTLAATAPVLDSLNARCQLLTIAGQETGWSERVQIPGGQARGWWQTEKDGMLSGVLNGKYVQTLAAVCDDLGIPTALDTLFEAIAWNDMLAYMVARLGLFMDPYPLPAIGDVDAAYANYIRVWRPGKPDRARWDTLYPQTCKVVLP